MAKQFMDDENNLKRQARRRLVGAVALVTALVVILPMLLDSAPKPVAQNIELQIPDKDKVEMLVPQLPPPTAAVDTPVTPPDEVVAAPIAPVTSPVATVSPPVAAEKQASSIVVQIGAFANAESAHQLQKKLSKQGIKAYTEKMDDKTRVRAGPYSSREAADKVIQKLEKQGLKPVISPSL